MPTTYDVEKKREEEEKENEKKISMLDECDLVST